MLDNECQCCCTPVKCGMPDELYFRVTGLNYSWTNRPLRAEAPDIPMESERTKCGPCKKPFILCGSGGLCLDLFCSDDGVAGCDDTPLEEGACDQPAGNVRLPWKCCTRNLVDDGRVYGGQHCVTSYQCKCSFSNSHLHRWPRDQWTGVGLCADNNHPICQQYPHICSQPPEPLEITYDGSWRLNDDGSLAEDYLSACVTEQNVSNYAEPGWGRDKEDESTTYHIPLNEKYSFETGFDVNKECPFNSLGYGELTGTTHLYAKDLNNRLTVLKRQVVDMQPSLRPTVARVRTPPANTPLINAELLFELKHFPVWRKDYELFPGFGVEYESDWFYEVAANGFNWAMWRVDYPCFPTPSPFECTGEPGGLVAPKLKALAEADASGSGAVISFTLKPLANPVSFEFGPEIPWPGAIYTEGFVHNGSQWYVASIGVEENKGGYGYKVGDKFKFDFYESPLRGGEMRVPLNDTYQRARVTSVAKDGAITGIELFILNQEDGETPAAADVCPTIGATYARLLPHRYAVARPGTGYVEGDTIVWECSANEPQGFGRPDHESIGDVARDGVFFFGCTVGKNEDGTENKARATVTEVDCRGGIVDWHMCGAINTFPAVPSPRPLPECGDYNECGIYNDWQYANQCIYHYSGYIPARYAYNSTWSDTPCFPCCPVGPFPRRYNFKRSRACGPAYCRFGLTIFQVSVKNRVIIEPPYPGGSLAAAKIVQVVPIPRGERRLYPRVPLTNRSGARTMGGNYAAGEAAIGTALGFPDSLPQGPVHLTEGIEITNAGSGYARKRDDGTVETKTPDFYVLAVGDHTDGNDIEIEIRGPGKRGRNKCYGHCVVDEDPESDTFGQITDIVIESQGNYYIAHEHDHVWLANAWTDFETYLDYAPAPLPTTDGSIYDPPEDFEFWAEDNCGAPILASWRKRRHSRRRSWGYAVHKDGYHEQPFSAGNAIQTFYFFRYQEQYNRRLTRQQYPTVPLTAHGYPEGTVFATPENALGDYENIWCKDFCPKALLERTYDMVWEQVGLPYIGGYNCQPNEDTMLDRRCQITRPPNVFGDCGIFPQGSSLYVNTDWVQTWADMDSGPIRFEYRPAD